MPSSLPKFEYPLPAATRFTPPTVAKPKHPSLLYRALDLLSRGNYASANAAKAVIEGGNPLVEAWHGLKGQDKTTYGDLVQEFIPDAPKPIKGILGFVLDVALDPTTYVGIGAATKVGEAVKLLDSAGDTIVEGSKLWKMGEELADKGIDKTVGRTLAEQADKGQRALLSFAGKPVIKGGKAFDVAENLWDKAKSNPLAEEFASKTRTRPLQVPLVKVMKDTGRSRIEVQDALKSAKSDKEFVGKMVKEGADDTSVALAKNTYNANKVRDVTIRKVDEQDAERVMLRLTENIAKAVRVKGEEVAKTLGVDYKDLSRAVGELERKDNPALSELAKKEEVQKYRNGIKKLYDDALAGEKADGIDIEALQGTLDYTPHRLSQKAKELIDKVTTKAQISSGRVKDVSVDLKAALEREWKDKTVLEINELAKKGELPPVNGIKLPAMDEFFIEDPAEQLIIRLHESAKARTAYRYVQGVLKEHGVFQPFATQPAKKAVEKEIKLIGKQMDKLRKTVKGEELAKTVGVAWDTQPGVFYTQAKEELAKLTKSYPKDSQLTGRIKYLSLRLDNLVEKETGRVASSTTGKMPGVAEAKAAAQVAGKTVDRLSAQASQLRYNKLAFKKRLGTDTSAVAEAFTPEQMAEIKRTVDKEGSPLDKLGSAWIARERSKLAGKVLPEAKATAKEASDAAEALAKQNALTGMSKAESLQYVDEALKRGDTSIVSEGAAKNAKRLTGALEDAKTRRSSISGQKGEIAKLKRSIARMDKTSILNKEELKTATKLALEGNPNWTSLLNKKEAYTEALKIPEGFKRVTGLIDSNKRSLKGSEDLVLPDVIADQVLYHWNKLNEKESVSAGLKLYDGAQSVWKKYVTFPFPSYGARNAISNVWQMALNGDVRDPRVFVVAGALQKGKAGVLTTAAGTKIDYADLWKAIEEHGLMGSGFMAGDIGQHASSILESTSKAGGVKGRIEDWKSLPKSVKEKGLGATLADNRPLQRAIEDNSFIEDNARIAMFVDGVQKGKSFGDAAAEAKRVMYDVGDMTDWERQKAKRIVPFYSWQRKNLPVALKSQAQHPWKAALPAKIRNNITDNTVNPEQDMQPWAQDMAAASWGGKVLPLGGMMPTLSGLQTVLAPGQSAVRSLSPVIKSAVNLATGANIERGYKFNNRKDLLTNIAMSVPIVGRPISEYKSAGRSDAPPLEKVLGYLTGIKRYDTPSQIAAAAKAKKKVAHFSY